MDGTFCCETPTLLFDVCPLQTPFYPYRRLRQRAADGAECVANLRAEQAHDGNHDDGDEREDDRILDEALAFFFGCE